MELDPSPPRHRVSCAVFGIRIQPLVFLVLYGKILSVREAMRVRARFRQNLMNVVGRLDKGQLGCAEGLVKE
jgi:hypothetical protein